MQSKGPNKKDRKSRFPHTILACDSFRIQPLQERFKINACDAPPRFGLFAATLETFFSLGTRKNNKVGLLAIWLVWPSANQSNRKGEMPKILLNGSVNKFFSVSERASVVCVVWLSQQQSKDMVPPKSGWLNQWIYWNFLQDSCYLSNMHYHKGQHNFGNSWRRIQGALYPAKFHFGSMLL